MNYDEILIDTIPDFLGKIEVMIVTAHMAEWNVNIRRSEIYLRDVIECSKNNKIDKFFRSILSINLVIDYNEDWSFKCAKLVWHVPHNSKKVMSGFGSIMETNNVKVIENMFEKIQKGLSTI